MVVETDRYRVEGMMTLAREGYRSRLSDHVNRRDQEFFTIDGRRAHGARRLRPRLDGARCSCSLGATSG